MNDSEKRTRLTPLQVDGALRRSVVAGWFASLFGVCCVSNQFLTGFVLQMIGSEDKRLASLASGLLVAIPSIAYAFQLWSAVLTERLRERRKLWFRLSFVGRVMWLVIALVPLLMGDDWLRTQLIILLFLFFVFSAANSAQSPVWFSWLADLVPKDQAGRWWGERRAILNMVGLAVLPTGLFLDWAVKTPWGKGSLTPYALLFAVGAVVGIADLLIHNTVPDPPMQGEPRQMSLRQMLAQPLRDPQFRRFMVYFCSWNFVINFGNAFLSLWYLNELGLSQAWIAFFSCAMVLTRMVMARYWGYLVDRYGAAPLNSICTFGLILVPLGYVFVDKSNAIPIITAIYVYSGFFNIGIETTQTALMLGISPAANKAMFIAVVQSLAGFCAAVSPILGAFFLNFAHDHPLDLGAWLHIGSWKVERFQELFLVAFLLRIVSAPLSLRLSQIQPGSVSLVVRRLFDANPFAVIHHTYVLFDSSAEVERIEAVRKLGHARSSIATKELINALTDPSLDVRIEAARALSRIGDTEAIQPLIESLKSPQSGIQQEAAAALGKIAHRRSVRALIEMLSEPTVQQAAIKALGEIKDSLAIHPLLDLVQQETTNASTRALAAEALCRLVENSSAIYDVFPRIFPVFRDAPAGLLRQQLALAVGNLLGEPGEFYDLLARERRLAGHGAARLIGRLRGKMLTGQRAWTKRHGKNLPEKKPGEGRFIELLEEAHTDYTLEQWALAAHRFALIGLGYAGLIELKDLSLTPAQRQAELSALENRLDFLDIPSQQKARLWLLVHTGIGLPPGNCAMREEALLALSALAGLWEEKP